MLLEITNPSTQGANKTSLSNNPEAGATSISVYSNQGFSSSQLILVENVGVQSAEIATISSLSGSTTINLASPLTLSHPQNATVSFYEADKIYIYKSTTGTTGDFTLYQTINVIPTDTYTTYFDNNITASSAYYTQLYNSVTGWVSGPSSIITQSGYSNGSFLDLKNRASRLIKDITGNFIDPYEMGIYLNEKYQMMQQIAVTLNKNYALIYQSPIVSTNLNQQEYPLPSDFWEIKYVLTSLQGSGTSANNLNFYTAMPATLETIFNIQYGYYPYMANNGYNFNMLAMPGIFEFYYMNGQNIGFYPFFAGQYKLLYYPTSSLMVNDSDVPYTPLRDFGYMLVDYAVLRAYQKSGRADMTRVEYFQKKCDQNDTLLINYLQERAVQFNPSVETTDTRYLNMVESDIYLSYFTV